jgi:hypothetical protein
LQSKQCMLSMGCDLGDLMEFTCVFTGLVFSKGKIWCFC